MGAPVAEVKPGVRPWSLHIFAAAVSAWYELGFLRYGPCVATSGNDSQHGQGSLHGFDRALDVRTRTIPRRDDKLAFLERVRARLGDRFDVILEDVGGANEHLHVEFDPKPQTRDNTGGTVRA
jgi:hypothetical protein